MALEVNVGTRNPIGQSGKSTVVVDFTDRLNLSGAALHIKLVVNDVPGETSEAFTARVANLAKRLADQMSTEIGAGAYRGREGLHWPESEPEIDVNAGGFDSGNA